MPAELIDLKAHIRERLVHTALRLFAEKGIDGVSMRAINVAAGSKNKSAVHYHFGNKLGILEAIFGMLHEVLAPLFDDLLDRIESKAETEEVSVPEILLTLYFPFFIIHSAGGFGPYVVKLVSKMMLDPTPEYQRIFNSHFHPYINRIYVLMEAQLPEKSEQHLRFQLIHSLMATITGIAAIEIMDSTPLGDVRFDNDVEMLLSYVDYITGGVIANESCVNQIDLNFWVEYYEDTQSMILG